MTPPLRQVLVTGASGFLGSHVVRALAARGVAVSAHGRSADRLGFGSGVRICRGDLADLPLLTEGATGCDAVVHCAALSAPWGDPKAFVAANVAGTVNLLTAARTAGVRRLVHISSPAVIFDGRDQHQVGDDAPYPASHSSHYARTKQLAEQLVRAAASSMETVILRPKAIYGDGDRALVPRLLRAAREGRLPQIGDGINAVDVTHVDDVVQAIDHALTTTDGVGGTFLVTGGEHVPLWGMIRELLEGVGLRYPSRRVPLPVALAAAAAMEAMATITRREPTLTRYSALILARTQTYDISRARTLLGYAPRVSAAQGVARTIDALRRGGQAA
ncbi:MAG: NAD-dependent epimerase/dehydratase family protein [Gemmatimonadota bacterium]